MFEKSFIPTLPFPDFKWKWASVQCTEGLNDPVVLLGVLFRMRKLEGQNLKYSSDAFASELIELSNDVSDSVDIDLTHRTGERNLIRNSGQYWKALGLIPSDSRGVITLTDFGRKVADHEISQSEFAAVTIQTFKLPNAVIQSPEECALWKKHGLGIYPLRLLLNILHKLREFEQSYVTTEELVRIIIPLSGCNATIGDYVNFIIWFRTDELSLTDWPDICSRDNDLRIAREYLLFLNNYGYITRSGGKTRKEEIYDYNAELDDEVQTILAGEPQSESIEKALISVRSTDAVSEMERKRTQISRSRPNQTRFRREVLDACKRCIITNVTMPEVLEAAHIKPYKYNGEDTVANGLAMRMDIHTLFDTGHLRINEIGEIHLTSRARMDYGSLIPPQIVIPPFTNVDFIRWRWDNYDGI